MEALEAFTVVKLPNKSLEQKNICLGRKFLLKVFFLSTIKLGHIITNFRYPPKGKTHKVNVYSCVVNCEWIMV